ncbi:MAG: hypothetical protein AAGA93_15055 [Actinomycetota bacterium]
MYGHLVAYWRRLDPGFLLSRHSALPELRRRLGPASRSFVARAVSLACGATLIGTSVAMLVEADLGLPPYDVLASGLAANLGLTLGQGAWLVAAFLFIAATVLGRQPSPWGVAYMLGIGLAIDAVANLLNQPETLAGRVGFLLVSTVVMAGGINLVLYSGTTGGPFELLMAAAEDRGISWVVARYGLDLGVLGAGLALGGAVGIGTLVYAATMGLVLQAVSQVFADHRAGRRHRLATGPAAAARSSVGPATEAAAEPTRR